MASTPQEKFDAAVKVIQSLPKEGPFQPSHEMMLMFYAYFKQATEGPCHRKKPYMWEVVAKAKWDAWNKLGDMNREVAMLNYVDELKKIIKINNEKWKEMEKKKDPRIVEAMPQTKDVGNFMETLGSFYEIVDEDSPLDDDQMSRIPNHTGGGGSAGVTPDHSHSDTSSEHDKEDYLNFSLQVDQILQQGSHIDEADAIPEFPGTESETTESGETIEDNLVVNGEEGEETAEEEAEEEEEEEEEEDTEKVVSNSESDEEFCDTSEINPAQEEVQVQETIPKTPYVTVQNSTPLKREIKQNHVRFATPTDSVQNGRVSPIMNDNVVELSEYLHMPSGFPFISNKLNGPLSESLLVHADDTCDVTTASLISPSVVTGLESGTESDYSANNSVLNPETPTGTSAGGGEENEPPGGGDKDRKGQGQRSKEGESSRSSQNSGRGVPTQGGSQRSVLLTGGGAGGGGEDNPPQGPPPSAHIDPVNNQIALILVRLQQDMTSVLERLNRLEQQSRQRQDSERRRTAVWRSWWPFSSVTGRTAFFVLVWPVIVHLVLSYLFRRRRRR